MENRDDEVDLQKSMPGSEEGTLAGGTPPNKQKGKFSSFGKIFKPWKWRKKRSSDTFLETSIVLERKISVRRPRQELIERGVLKELPENESNNTNSTQVPVVKNGHPVPMDIDRVSELGPRMSRGEPGSGVNPTWLPQVDDPRHSTMPSDNARSRSRVSSDATRSNRAPLDVDSHARLSAVDVDRRSRIPSDRSEIRWPLPKGPAQEEGRLRREPRYEREERDRDERRDDRERKEKKDDRILREERDKGRDDREREKEEREKRDGKEKKDDRSNETRDGKEKKDDRSNETRDGKEKKDDRINEKRDGKEKKDDRVNENRDGKEKKDDRINEKRDGKEKKDDRINEKRDGKEKKDDRINEKRDGKDDRYKRVDREKLDERRDADRRDDRVEEMDLRGPPRDVKPEILRTIEEGRPVVRPHSELELRPSLLKASSEDRTSRVRPASEAGFSSTLPRYMPSEKIGAGEVRGRTEAAGVRFAPPPDPTSRKETPPTKQAMLPPKKNPSATSTTEPGGNPTPPSSSSSSTSSAVAVAKPPRTVSLVTSDDSLPTAVLPSPVPAPRSSSIPLSSTGESENAPPVPPHAKQPPVPPPKPANRNSNPALLASTLNRASRVCGPPPQYWTSWRRQGEMGLYLSLPTYLHRRRAEGAHSGTLAVRGGATRGRPTGLEHHPARASITAGGLVHLHL